MPLVAEEDVHLIPGDVTAKSRIRKQGVETTWCGTAGERDRESALCPHCFPGGGCKNGCGRLNECGRVIDAPDFTRCCHRWCQSFRPRAWKVTTYGRIT